MQLDRRQFGRSTPMLTLQLYEALIPTSEERVHWAQHATQPVARRKVA